MTNPNENPMTTGEQARDLRHLIVMETQFQWSGQTTLKLPEIERLVARGWVAEGEENCEYDITDDGRATIESALSQAQQGDAVDLLEDLNAKWCASTAGKPGSRRIATHDALRQNRGEDDFDNEVAAIRRCASDLAGVIERIRKPSPAKQQGREAVSTLVRTAPEVIYLQIADEDYSHEPFPAHAGDQVTWCASSCVECEVKYIRADLALPPPAPVAHAVRAWVIADGQGKRWRC